MNPKKLGILAIVAVILVIAAISQKKQDYSQPESDQETAKVFEALDVNAISQISMTSSGGTVQLSVNDQDTWVVDKAYGFPVDFEKLRAFLIKINELNRGAIITADDDQLAEMKLVNPAEAGPANFADAGTLISFKDATGKDLGSLLIGKTFEKAAQAGAPQMPMGMGRDSGNFVKTSNGDIYVVTTTLSEALNTPKDWINKELVNIPSHKVEDIKISGADRKEVHIAKTALHELQNVPEGYEADAGSVSSLTGALSYLSLTEIADPAGSDEDYGFDKAVKVTVITFDKQLLTILIGASPEGSKDRYVRMSMAMLPKAETGDSEEKPEDVAKASDEASSLNKRLSGWTFVIPSYKADILLKPFDEVIKIIEPPETKRKEETEDAAPAKGESP